MCKGTDNNRESLGATMEKYIHDLGGYSTDYQPHTTLALKLFFANYGKHAKNYGKGTEGEVFLE